MPGRDGTGPRGMRPQDGKGQGQWCGFFRLGQTSLGLPSQKPGRGFCRRFCFGGDLFSHPQNTEKQ